MKRLLFPLMAGLLVCSGACRRTYPTVPPPILNSPTPTITPLLLTSSPTPTWTAPVTAISPTPTPTVPPLTGFSSFTKSESASSVSSGQNLTYVLSYSVLASASNPVTLYDITEPYPASNITPTGQSLTNSGGAVGSVPYTGLLEWVFPNPFTSNFSGSITWWGTVACTTSGPLTDTARLDWGSQGVTD